MFTRFYVHLWIKWLLPSTSSIQEEAATFCFLSIPSAVFHFREFGGLGKNLWVRRWVVLVQDELLDLSVLQLIMMENCEKQESKSPQGSRKKKKKKAFEQSIAE